MSVETAAARVVEELGIEQAVADHIDLLHSRLTEDEVEALRSTGGKKLSLLAMLLPTVNVFINYASSRRRLTSALNWLRAEWGASPEEAVALLGTFTLLYITEKGLLLHAKDPAKVEDWSRLRKCVSDVEAEVAASA
jgi:hypothetical protein